MTRQTHSIIAALTCFIGCGIFWTSTAQAERVAVAISPFSGPKAAKSQSFEDALVRAFKAQDLDLIVPSAVRKVAKKKKANVRGNYAAELSGADYRLFAKFSGKRGRYQMRVQLIELFNDKTIEKAKWNYKISRKSSADAISENAEKAAQAICDKFVKKISKHFPTLVGRRSALAGELPQPKSGS